MDLNKNIFIGRLADNVRFYPADKDKKTPARALGRLIVNRPGSRTNKYDVIPLVFWDTAAENAATYTSKGKEIGVVCEFRTEFQPGRTKDEGQTKFEFKVLEITFGADSTTVKTQRAQQQMASMPAEDRAAMTRAMDLLGGREELKTAVRRSKSPVAPPPSPPPAAVDDIPVGEMPDWLGSDPT
jgi:single-stranded DNA-binding protein